MVVELYMSRPRSLIAIDTPHFLSLLVSRSGLCVHPSLVPYLTSTLTLLTCSYRLVCPFRHSTPCFRIPRILVGLCILELLALWLGIGIATGLEPLAVGTPLWSTMYLSIPIPFKIVVLPLEEPSINDVTLFLTTLDPPLPLVTIRHKCLTPP